LLRGACDESDVLYQQCFKTKFRSAKNILSRRRRHESIRATFIRSRRCGRRSTSETRLIWQQLELDARNRRALGIADLAFKRGGVFRGGTDLLRRRRNAGDQGRYGPQTDTENRFSDPPESGGRKHLRAANDFRLLAGRSQRRRYRRRQVFTAEPEMTWAEPEAAGATGERAWFGERCRARIL